MKKNCVFITMLIFVLMLALCSCDASKTLALGDIFSPWGDKNVENNPNGGNNTAPQTYKIYVCGAVEKEGYYDVSEGDTYFSAITHAGLLPNLSWLPANAHSVVDERQKSILVQYIENDAPRDCINANSQFFSLRDAIYFDGLSEAVVNKIANYLETHGKIANKTVLLDVLGEEDYANYHYKLYIAEADYEEAN